MSRSRQRRKERRAAINAEERPEQEPQGSGTITASDVSMPVEEREEFDRGLTEQAEADRRREDDAEEAAELIAALGPLRETRANPLTAGIQVFTAMLEQARGGYAADRLAEIEAAMQVSFNSLEAQGIIQIAMANMDETGVPDVEHGIQLCLEARVEAAGVVEDHGDGSQVDGATEPESEEEPEDEDAKAAAAEEKESDKPGPED